MELKRDPETGETKHEFASSVICSDHPRPRTVLDEIHWIIMHGYDRDITQSNEAIQP
jgi:hypothetical protein